MERKSIDYEPSFEDKETEIFSLRVSGPLMSNLGRKMLGKEIKLLDSMTMEDLGF